MPARKPIRRSQLIGAFGIGAMVDFPGDESLLTAGLDAWPFARDKCPPDWLVIEDRLQARLGVSHFRLPPEHRDPAPGIVYPNQDIPFVRFPRWHYCHHCGSMEFLSLFGSQQRCAGYRYVGLTCADTPERRRPFLIPVRIVAVCNRGHIQDFPFLEWVHRDKPVQPGCRLRLRAGRSSATLSGIKIECTCGEWRSLGGVFDFDANTGGALHSTGYDCSGDRPWLGESENPRNNCGEFLRVVQRGASNVYFPHVISSIYLPLWGEKSSRNIVRTLEDPNVWQILSTGLVEGKFVDQVRCETVANLYRLDVKELQESAQRKLDGIPMDVDRTEEDYRRQEYDALRTGRGGVNTDLLVDVVNGTEYGPEVSDYFSRVCLVRKLRETRALAGFTRLLPPMDQVGRVQDLKLDLSLDWLPATVVRGEGIFLEFSITRITDWLSTRQCITRIEQLSRTYNERRILRGLPPRIIEPGFVMIHTLAHILISQLSFDCGYGSASLRERIYWDNQGVSELMHGILIYTASGDSEGTMGGLVRQGEPDRLEVTLLRALRRAQWCSSDPVCIESSGQGSDNANLAACHGCALISETSCEEGNRLLDRALLVGIPGNPKLGFFKDIT